MSWVGFRPTHKHVSSVQTFKCLPCMVVNHTVWATYRLILHLSEKSWQQIACIWYDYLTMFSRGKIVWYIPQFDWYIYIYNISLYNIFYKYIIKHLDNQSNTNGEKKKTNSIVIAYLLIIQVASYNHHGKHLI